MKKGGGKFRNKWNVPHTVGIIDGKHIAMKKPRKTDIDKYNYKCFFYLVFLALEDAEYSFLLIDCGLSGSCSDAQIFSRSLLREEIENGSLGFQPLESLGKGGPDLLCFLLGDNAVALDGKTLHPKTFDHGRKNSQLQALQGQKGG